MLIAFDSNVLTAFLDANSALSEPTGDRLAAFQLFVYAPRLVILPTVTAEATRIPKFDKRGEHLKWVWYHFNEAQLGCERQRIENRAQALLPHHPQKDPDDCRIVAEAEIAGAHVLATIDKKIKKLQAHTHVRLLTPTGALEYAGVNGDRPQREPSQGHPHARAKWWRF